VENTDYIVLIILYHLSTSATGGKKRALKLKTSFKVPPPEGFREATYKQALRGLFVAGTSEFA
jgi:hypothetical protein